MNKKSLQALILPLAALVFMPAIAHAQTIDAILRFFTDTFQQLLPVFVGVALILFLFGLVSFLMNAGDARARVIGRNFMIWGTIALFVMVSVWGIVAVLISLFGTEDVGDTQVPYVNVTTN